MVRKVFSFSKRCQACLGNLATAPHGTALRQGQGGNFEGGQPLKSHPLGGTKPFLWFISLLWPPEASQRGYEQALSPECLGVELGVLHKIWMCQ